MTFSSPAKTSRTALLGSFPRRFFRGLQAVVPGIVSGVRRDWRSIPLVSLDRVLGMRRADIRMIVRDSEDGMLPHAQAVALLALLAVERPRVVLEIGTFMGHTTRAMAMNLPDSIIHTVDLPSEYLPGKETDPALRKDDHHLIFRRVVGREFAGTPEADRIFQHYADTAEWDFTRAKGADFFFIDGAHTYEYCRNDSEKCYELCGGKGVFLWHDCDRKHPGVVRLIREWRARGRDIVRISGTSLAYWKSDGSLTPDN